MTTKVFKKFFLLVIILLPITTSYAQEWSTLNVVILGDSNTWLGGDDCTKPQGWNTWFRALLKPASCHSYARSGATWTHTLDTKRNTKEITGVLSNDNVIYNQICRLVEDTNQGVQPIPELILIAAGTNDAWFPQYRPQMWDKSVEEVFDIDQETLMKHKPSEICTLAEAIRYDCEFLFSQYPQARIILLTPIQSVAIPINQIKRIAGLIDACAKRMDLPVIRMDHEECINAKNERKQYYYTYDGTHTNESGAQHNGQYIAQQLSKILTK